MSFQTYILSYVLKKNLPQIFLSFKKAKTPAIIKANKLRTTIGLRVKTKYKIGLNIAAFRGRN